MEILGILDTYLLDKFQKISNKIQDWVGLTNFRIARVCMILFFILRILHMVLDQSHKFNSFSLIFGVLIFVFLLFYYPYSLNKVENSSANKIFKNELVLRWSFYRPIVAFLFIFGFTMSIPFLLHTHDPIAEKGPEYPKFIMIIGDIQQVFDVLFLYFASCTPKPKKPSKLKKFIEKLKTSFSPSPQGTLVPNLVKAYKSH